MQFKKVNFESLKLGDDANVSKSYTRQVEADSRLTSFIGNKPLCESEQSDETESKEDFETFISKGSDALIRDHQELVKRLIWVETKQLCKFWGGLSMRKIKSRYLSAQQIQEILKHDRYLPTTILSAQKKDYIVKPRTIFGSHKKSSKKLFK